MTQSFNVKENLDTIFQNLEKYLTTKTVIGEPIKIGDITLIPIICVSFGLGTGGGDGRDEKGSGGNGGGAGGGARIAPAAILVIKGDSVELLPIKKHSGLDKLLEMVPELIDKCKSDCCDGKKE
jgi:uncharacterized spore protein YtfJ